MKIRPVTVQLFNTDGETHTDKAKLIVAFRNFANAPAITEYPSNLKVALEILTQNTILM